MKKLFLFMSLLMASHSYAGFFDPSPGSLKMKSCKIYVRHLGYQGWSTECGDHVYSLETPSIVQLLLKKGYKFAGYSNYPNSRFCSMGGVNYLDGSGLNWQADESKPGRWDNLLLYVDSPWHPYYRYGVPMEGDVYLYQWVNSQSLLIAHEKRIAKTSEEMDQVAGAYEALKHLPNCKEE